jgi:hypothetical protein
MPSNLGLSQTSVSKNEESREIVGNLETNRSEPVDPRL